MDWSFALLSTAHREIDPILRPPRSSSGPATSREISCLILVRPLDRSGFEKRRSGSHTYRGGTEDPSDPRRHEHGHQEAIACPAGCRQPRPDPRARRRAVNNLKDVSVEIPKRRLTVFTGVSGSGKSSLVFGTIAAESQRLINETYSAFVQGFMPTLARPDVDVLDGLTTAIIVDQQRMGADARSTVGTATDANAMLRILFSRLGKPHIGSPNAFSFNVAVGPRERCDHGRAGRRQDRAEAPFTRTGGMCPRCEGMGLGQRHRPVPSCTTTASRSTRARSRSPATAWTAGSAASSAAAASSTRTSRSASSPRRSSTTSSTRSRPRSRSTASTSPTRA